EGRPGTDLGPAPVGGAPRIPVAAEPVTASSGPVPHPARTPLAVGGTALQLCRAVVPVRLRRAGRLSDPPETRDTGPRARPERPVEHRGRSEDGGRGAMRAAEAVSGSGSATAPSLPSSTWRRRWRR